MLAAAAVRVAFATWYIAVYLVRLLGLATHVRRSLFECRPKDPQRSRPLTPSEHTAQQPGVTILRPMKGADDHELAACLRSTFVQTYEPFEILMCVADATDPAVNVANMLIAEFPHVDARVLLGPDIEYGLNPKINNLVKGYKAAKYDIVWALDANVIMDRDALSRALPKFDKKNVELVHHLPVAICEPHAGWGALLDETYMLTAHSTFYTGINAVGIAPCVTGKSNLYRRSSLDDGRTPGEGLQRFAKYMAEDQMISEALWARGGRTAMAPDAAIQPLGQHTTFSDYWLRRARWVRLRKYMVTAATLVEPFTDCFFGCAILCWVMGWGLLKFGLLVALWGLVDYANYRILFCYTSKTPRRLGPWILTWLVREAIAFPLWLWAMSGRRIYWRDKPFRIRHDLVAELV